MQHISPWFGRVFRGVEQSLVSKHGQASQANTASDPPNQRGRNPETLFPLSPWCAPAPLALVCLGGDLSSCPLRGRPGAMGEVGRPSSVPSTPGPGRGWEHLSDGAGVRAMARGHGPAGAEDEVLRDGHWHLRSLGNRCPMAPHGEGHRLPGVLGPAQSFQMSKSHN